MGRRSIAVLHVTRVDVGGKIHGTTVSASGGFDTCIDRELVAVSGTESHTDRPDSLIVWRVERSRFLHEIVEKGELESGDSVEVRREVTGRRGTATLPQ